MVRYKITIEYDGTNYVGWQKQDGHASVQGSIEEAILKLTKQESLVYGSGRTDKGVHALGQVAHFDIEGEYDPDKIRLSLNHFLKPQPISIVEVEKVDDNFHARFSAQKRYYKYLILNRRAAPAIDKNRVWHVREKLDIKKIQEAADYLEGHHDFSSFRSSVCQSNNPVKTLDKITIEKDGDYISFYLSSKSFLHHQVRNIVGTLKMVGEGKLEPIDVKKILEEKDRTKAGMNCPPDGLYFMRVDF